MTEKPQETDEEAPTNPLYGKFEEVSKALVKEKPEVKYSRPMPEEEGGELEMTKPVKWVTLLSECTIRKMFDIIYDQVAFDVMQRNGLGYPLGFEFEVDDERNGKVPGFTVSKLALTVNNLVISAVFTCEEDNGQIRIEAPGGKPFFVTRGWDDESRSCILSVDGKRTEPWEVSKRALEKSFFS